MVLQQWCIIKPKKENDKKIYPPTRLLSETPGYTGDQRIHPFRARTVTRDVTTGPSTDPGHRSDPFDSWHNWV